MRAFIILAVIACAHADVGGYNYNAGSTGANSFHAGNTFGSSEGVISSGFQGLTGGISSSGFQGSTGGISSSGFQGSTGGLSSSGFQGSTGGLSSSGFQGSTGGISSSGFHGSNSATHGVADHGVPQTEYTKEFYTYTAPEADFNDAQSLGDLSSSSKRNLRVVFIRGPEQSGLENAALNLARSAVEDRTAIYVLTKQTDASTLANQLRNLNGHNANKPEVHFVKYRTPEDAVHAQHAIQSQYDSLGGNSQSHDGGVAGVLDFSSKVAVAPSHHHATVSHGDHYAHAPANTYIPPSVGQTSSPSATYLPIKKL